MFLILNSCDINGILSNPPDQNPPAFKIHLRSKSTHSNSRTAYRSRVKVGVTVILKKIIQKIYKLINNQNIKNTGWILIVYL